MYIVSQRILNKETNNRYFLRLNREESCLEIYEQAENAILKENYPIRDDFDSSEYVMYKMIKKMRCIFGGEGKTRTPRGIFNIEKVSEDEYISPYHPHYEFVKFFGYLVVFEDYFIHSDLYLTDVGIDNYKKNQSISLNDKNTAGCIRVAQDDLQWLIENIEVGTTIEM